MEEWHFGSMLLPMLYYVLGAIVSIVNKCVGRCRVPEVAISPWCNLEVLLFLNVGKKVLRFLQCVEERVNLIEHVHFVDVFSAQPFYDKWLGVRMARFLILC